jgi:hypothetical protein
MKNINFKRKNWINKIKLNNSVIMITKKNTSKILEDLKIYNKIRAVQTIFKMASISNKIRNS